MNDALPPADDPVLPDAEELSIADEVKRLADDARTFAEAEIGYQKARAGVALGGARSVAALLVAGFVLAVFALVALVVGLVIALIPLVTAWGATAIVAGGLLLLALLCLLAAKRRWRATLRAVGGGADERT